MYLDEHDKRYGAKLAIDWLLGHLPNGPLHGELKRHLELFPEDAEVIQRAFEMAVQFGYEHAERRPAPLRDVGRGDP
jgi:hypothetical protein